MNDTRQLPSRMNATDALFWLLEPMPEFRSSIAALLILDGVPSRERIDAECRRLVGAYPRLRQRVAETPLGIAPPEWVADPDFDLDYHVRTMAVTPPGTIDDLLDELAPLFATPLDRERPLWELYFAAPISGGRAAVFLKLHHCLMDGVGGTRLLTLLLGERRDTAAATPIPPCPAPPMTPSARLAYELGELASAARASASMVADGMWHPLATVTGVARGLASALGIGRELTIPAATSPLRRRPSLARRLATFDMSLAAIDAVRGRLTATNNDILLAVVCGALHRWHTSRGADVKELRALVPVNVRRATDDLTGNRLALLAVALPIGEPNRLVQERMGRVKADRRAALYPVVASMVRMLPPALAARIVGQQMHRANFVCTNVPGPVETCYFAGHAIESIHAYAPMVGDHPFSIAAYRYRDTVYVGLDLDPVAMPDFPRLYDAFRESWAELQAVAATEEHQVPPAAAVDMAAP
jgi:WS/DGAT/MGAT family acyltransferase